MRAKTTIIVHRGALGDFLCAWPALRSLAARFPGALWAGRAAYGPWVESLGLAPCPGPLRAALDRAYGADAPPELPLPDAGLGRSGPAHPPGRPPLLAPADAQTVKASDGRTVPDKSPGPGEAAATDSPFSMVTPSFAASPFSTDTPIPENAEHPPETRVFWFGLERAAWDFSAPGWVFLPSVVPGRAVPPRVPHREALARAGVPWRDGWCAAWRRLHGGWSNKGAVDRVVLFAGAGHRAKQWPLVQFLELARRITAHGLEPVFALGPAELEHGMRIEEFRTVAPQDFQELAALLRSARAVVGNDCGPLHLAGLTGVPTVALFGPTDPAQWAPAFCPADGAPQPDGAAGNAAREHERPDGLTVLTADAACAPCTATTAGLDCPEPRCLAAIAVDRVEAALAAYLAGR
ncbi:MAG: glycosyltransferase family 9 protein [Desulfovibrionaceae bacterium]|jgi:hypothetical protein|nr:glycosyltransferase family 9 protein [Desulfovibrionaceae bacterium]